MAALDARDAVEKSNMTIYEAYTRMADRAGKFESQEGQDVEADDRSPKLLTSAATGPGRKGGKLGATPPPGEPISKVRQDLAQAQQMRADLQVRLTTTAEELEKLQTKAKADTRRLNELTAERSHLSIRLKDRDAELKGKAKLLEDVQDELVSLNLQLNMADEQSKKLKQENKELVDRWMERMGKEADAMNEKSKFS